MAIPTCTVTASTVAAILGDGVDPGSVGDVELLAGMVLTFTSNIPAGTFIGVDSSLYLIGTVQGIVDTDGVLKRIDPDTGATGAAGVVLLADDPVLQLQNQLEWQVHSSAITIGNRKMRIRPWSFIAPTNGVTASLADLAPVTGSTAL